MIPFSFPLISSIDTSNVFDSIATQNFAITRLRHCPRLQSFHARLSSPSRRENEKNTLSKFFILENEDSCIGDVFQIEPKPPILVEFTLDHPIPSALEIWDTTATDQHLNQNTTATNQHLSRDTSATNQDPNTTATNQDSNSLGDEINGTNPSMPLHKHEKTMTREKTSKTEHELHVYSRKRHLHRKEDSTLQ